MTKQAAKDKIAEAIVEAAPAAIVDEPSTDEAIVPEVAPTEDSSANNPPTEVDNADQDNPEAIEKLAKLAEVLGIPFKNPEDFLADHEIELAAIAELTTQVNAIEEQKKPLVAAIAVHQAKVKETAPLLQRQRDLAQTAKKFGLPVPRAWAELLETPKVSGGGRAAAGEQYRFHGFAAHPKLGNHARNLYAGLFECSANSGGTGKEGRMKTSEFVALVKQQGKAWPMKVDDTIEVTLPNGEKGLVTRTA